MNCLDVAKNMKSLVEMDTSLEVLMLPAEFRSRYDKTKGK